MSKSTEYVHLVCYQEPDGMFVFKRYPSNVPEIMFESELMMNGVIFKNIKFFHNEIDFNKAQNKGAKNGE